MTLVAQNDDNPEILQRRVLVNRSLGGLLGMDNSELSAVDPLSVNLQVARGVPQLSDLDIPSYQRLADEWAAGARDFIRDVEPEFYRDPGRWKSDISFFRLGCLCEFIDCELGIRYNEDQRDEKAVLYADPSDLFLN